MLHLDMEYKVTYQTKTNDGFLVTRIKRFDTCQAAVQFVRELQGKKTYGKAVLENN